MQLLLSEFAATGMQAENLSLVSPDHAKELQKAIAMVVDHGGTIEIERESQSAEQPRYAATTDAFGGTRVFGRDISLYL